MAPQICGAFIYTAHFANYLAFVANNEIYKTLYCFFRINSNHALVSSFRKDFS